MKIYQGDLTHIAGGRAAKSEGKKRNYYLMGAAGGLMAGALVAKANLWAGVAVCVIALGVFLWYQNEFNKKKSIIEAALKEEYNSEDVPDVKVGK